MRVYLDKVRLLDGQRFDVGFIQGLASSAVFGPLMSGSCMKSFVDLAHTDREDFVLMEWIVALELHKQGVIKAIFPIVMGEQSPEDGSYSQTFFEKLRDGQVHWPAAGDNPAGNAELPDVVSAKTVAKAREFLQMLSPPVELSEELTVRRAVERMLQFQAILLHFENTEVAAKVQRAREQSGGAGQLVRVGSAHGREAQRISREHLVGVCAER